MNPLIEVKNLSVKFPVFKGKLVKRHVGDIRAVDGVNLAINKGETLGLVGESGCGKTSTGRAILQLNKSFSGEIIFNGHNITKLNKTLLRKLRKQMQVIFQDPFGSLNPRMTAREIIGEPLIVHKMNGSKREYLKRIDELLETVGLSTQMARRYPHEFSGGQRQRIGIARALSVNPEFIVCDEPVSALDVSIQAQIINLLEGLQEQFQLTYLFIAHDLAVVRHMSNRIAVMYLGEIIELAKRGDLYKNPCHPYTKMLLSAIPTLDPVFESHRDTEMIKGEIPSPLTPPKGCKFHPRCEYVLPICKTQKPKGKIVNEKNHWVACHLNI